MTKERVYFQFITHRSSFHHSLSSHSLVAHFRHISHLTHLALTLVWVEVLQRPKIEEPQLVARDLHVVIADEFLAVRLHIIERPFDLSMELAIELNGG